MNPVGLPILIIHRLLTRLLIVNRRFDFLIVCLAFGQHALVVTRHHLDEFLHHVGPFGKQSFRNFRISDSLMLLDKLHQLRNVFVGEIAILCDMPRTATITATSELDTLRISKDLFFRLVNEFPTMAVEIMRELARRLDQGNQQLTAAKQRIEELESASAG